MIEFTYNGTKYRVTDVQEIDESLTNIHAELVKNNKEPRIYFAGKVLKKRYHIRKSRRHVLSFKSE